MRPALIKFADEQEEQKKTFTDQFQKDTRKAFQRAMQNFAVIKKLIGNGHGTCQNQKLHISSVMLTIKLLLGSFHFSGYVTLRGTIT